MLLDLYLTTNDISTRDFAKRIGRDRTFVARLREGRNGASTSTTQKIIEVTAGQVTAADLHMARLNFERSKKAGAKGATAEAAQ